MNSLIERIRKARQSRVTVEGKTFTVRRPTDWEAYEMRKDTREMDVLEKFVEGWEGVTELDLVPGGDATPAEFSKELFAEWIQDHPDFWAPIIGAITSGYQTHAENLSDTGKK